jgi:hypothetical protein
MGWSELAATWVACTDGDGANRGGAAYIFGGETRVGGENQALDGIWCYDDRPGVPGRIERVGQMPAPRSSAVATTVPGRGGAQRALVIGGSPGREMIPHRDALLIELDGCGCNPIPATAMRSVAVPVDGFLYLHAATPLDDGSVLMVGGITLLTDAGEATGESAIFIPELP